MVVNLRKPPKKVVITTLSEVDEEFFVVRWIAASEYASERQKTKQPWEPYNLKYILRCMARHTPKEVTRKLRGLLVKDLQNFLEMVEKMRKPEMFNAPKTSGCQLVSS